MTLALGLSSTPWSTSVATGATRSTAATWTHLLARAHDLGPSAATRAEVLVQLHARSAPSTLRRWARRNALSVTQIHDESTVVLSGPPAALGQALGVEIDDYELSGYGRFYAAKGQPAVPDALRASVAAFGRISSLGQVHAEGAPIVGLGPGGFIDAYDARPLWSLGDFGKGQTILFFEVDGFSQRDLATYAAQFGLPPFADPLPHLGALGLQPEGESDMDLEAAHAIAPDARLVYVDLDSFGGKNASPAAQFAQAFAMASQRYPGAIWSVSLGQCEDVFSSADATTVNRVVTTAESHGTSAFVASGDSGGLECLGINQVDPTIPAKGISFPGDLPAVTSVGGTTLHVTSTGTYRSETTWSEPLLSQGSTGGQSTLFQMATWQQRGPGAISTYSSGTPCGAGPGKYCREVPDVAADADPTTGAAVRFDGKWETNGGTSLATPEWAAFTALIDEYLSSRGDRPVGFFNPLLYDLAAGSQPYPAFHDITLGANDFFPAAPGYNMVTGLGSPDVWNIARDLVPLVGSR
jgi:kumamolisin